MPSEELPSASSGDAISRVESLINNIIDANDKAHEALKDITTSATQAVAARTQIVDAQAVIATKSDHIQKAQEHADKVRAELDRALTAATQQATEAEGYKSRAQSAADNSATALAELQRVKASVETLVSAIETARETADEASSMMKGLADKSATIEARVADYEKRLADFEQQSEARLKDIEGLLPGATVAGLASSWNERQRAFLKPHSRWQWIFVGSVLALVLIALTGLIQVYHLEAAPTYDEILRLWLSRLPIAGALIWLALHASRESALAKRLEEDYGYKAAVASCLLGFQKQISHVGSDAADNPALAKLLENTLQTIASPPGRIYDQHKLTVSPSSELAEAAKSVTEVANSARTVQN